MTGCFAVSNSVTVTKSIVNGGAISFNGLTTIDACDSNGMGISPDLMDAFGPNMEWVVSMANGLIVLTSDTLPLTRRLHG